MIRKLIVNTLYDFAKLITYAADALAPSCDNIWRERAWQRWDSQRIQQRPYQRYPTEPCVEHATRH